MNIPDDYYAPSGLNILKGFAGFATFIGGLYHGFADAKGIISPNLEFTLKYAPIFVGGFFGYLDGSKMMRDSRIKENLKSKIQGDLEEKVVMPNGSVQIRDEFIESKMKAAPIIGVIGGAIGLTIPNVIGYFIGNFFGKHF